MPDASVRPSLASLLESMVASARHEKTTYRLVSKTDGTHLSFTKGDFTADGLLETADEANIRSVMPSNLTGGVGDLDELYESLSGTYPNTEQNVKALVLKATGEKLVEDPDSEWMLEVAMRLVLQELAKDLAEETRPEAGEGEQPKS
jgi:hypothetical protein